MPSSNTAKLAQIQRKRQREQTGCDLLYDVEDLARFRYRRSTWLSQVSGDELPVETREGQNPPGTTSEGQKPNWLEQADWHDRNPP